MDHLVIVVLAAKNAPLHQAHTTGATDSAPAIVRQFDAIEQSRVEQNVATVGRERFSIQCHLAGLFHFSTSSRIGLTCRVCRIWLWSNAATRMKTPVLIGTSYSL